MVDSEPTREPTPTDADGDNGGPDSPTPAKRRRRRRRRKPASAQSDQDASREADRDHSRDSDRDHSREAARNDTRDSDREDARTPPTPRRRPEAARKPSEPEPWDEVASRPEPMEGKIRFHDLSIPEPILHAVADLGFTHCTPIQAEIMPPTLEGKDAMGKAQTGTGKSAAFLIAIFNHLLRNPPPENWRRGTPRALIIAPTRELALQIERDAIDLAKYTDLVLVAVFGGMDYEKQQRKLTEQHVDVVIATPGRLLDFKRRRDIHLGHVEILVLDEADRMLDMGFIPDVRNIIQSTPPKTHRQTMFFSATLNADVYRLANLWTRDPVQVEIEPEHVAVDTVDQKVYIVTTQEKFPLLLNIIKRENAERVMVFANRRDQTRKLADLLHRYDISCAMLSGDVPQQKRIRTLERFREGKVRVLVATDVAGRGIHVEGVSHVVNFTLPQDPEDYVHRIGRTGRAGASGISISFACEEDAFQIPLIEEFMGRSLPGIHPEDEWVQLPPRPAHTERHDTENPALDGGGDRDRNRRRGGRGGSGDSRGGERRGGGDRRGGRRSESGSRGRSR